MFSLKSTGQSLIAAAAFFTILGGAKVSFAHGGDEESRVAIELESDSKIQAGTSTVRFQLVDTKLNRLVTPSDLNISHERKLHFIVYDPSLQQFQHVHPEYNGQLWTVELSFQVNGNYFVWAQGELQNGPEEFNSSTRIEIVGGQPSLPAPTLPDVRTGTLTGSIATLSSTPLNAGKMAMLTLSFTREDGSAAEITPYLGAFAHVIATPEDGDTLLHVHPMNGSKPNEGMLHATFPAAGGYRIWVQFIDAGVLKTVPLSVIVRK